MAETWWIEEEKWRLFRPHLDTNGAGQKPRSSTSCLQSVARNFCSKAQMTTCWENPSPHFHPQLHTARWALPWQPTRVPNAYSSSTPWASSYLAEGETREVPMSPCCPYQPGTLASRLVPQCQVSPRGSGLWLRGHPSGSLPTLLLSLLGQPSTVRACPFISSHPRRLVTCKLALLPIIGLKKKKKLLPP